MEVFVRTKSATLSRRMPSVLLLSIFQFLPLVELQHTSWVCTVWYNAWKLPMASHLLASAQNELALSYDLGEGGVKDVQKAIRLYQASADKGNAKAQFNLGLCYEQGEGVRADIKEAIRLYELAAQQGDADAQCHLAELYDEGKRIPRNLEKAIYWYRLSAAQGNAMAQYYLGRLLQNWQWCSC